MFSYLFIKRVAGTVLLPFTWVKYCEMRSYFRFMSSSTGRWMRAIIGLALIIWGYGPADNSNMVLIAVGTLLMIAAVADWCILAPLFGYPLKGKKIIQKYGSLGDPGEA